jgi:hypothetical protein
LRSAVSDLSANHTGAVLSKNIDSLRKEAIGFNSRINGGKIFEILATNSYEVE